MSLMCIDLYETGGLLLFSSKSIIFQTADLERVLEKAENIINFYLDFNWELRFIEAKLRIFGDMLPYLSQLVPADHLENIRSFATGGLMPDFYC